MGFIAGRGTGRRLLTAAAVVVTAGGALLVASPPAGAVPNWEVTISCTEDVILPGEPGDFYTFNFDPACKHPQYGTANVYNKFDDGDGWFTGIGFLGIPSNLAAVPFYNWGACMDFCPGPTDWYSSAVENTYPDPSYPLTSMVGIELQAENYRGDPIGLRGALVGALSAGGETFGIYWGNPASPGGGSAATPTPIYMLTSNADDRGTCWPTISSVSGSWVQLTASGCSAPADKPGSTLLGWATSPAFPVAEAKKVVDNGWSAYDGPIDGVRMIFIPVGGYTLLTGDNTMYPIWSQ